MKEFEVEITETLKKTICVEADSHEDARNKVIDGYYNGDYIIGERDLQNVCFKVTRVRKGCE